MTSALHDARVDPLDERNAARIAALLPYVRFINRYYLRLRADGQENLPDGPALLVANHNGGIAGPDLLCTMGTLIEALGPNAPLYQLAHDLAMRTLRPLGRQLRKLGCVRATPENALRAFAMGAKVLVYPGGDLDAYRTFAQRDQVIFGARTGFARVAQRGGVPIVPVVTQGAHRSAYIFDDGAWLAHAIGMPRWGRVERCPLALALPYGLAIGPYLPYFPLPFQIRLRILPAIMPNADEEPALLRERVRMKMQSALDIMSQER